MYPSSRTNWLCQWFQPCYQTFRCCAVSGVDFGGGGRRGRSAMCGTLFGGGWGEQVVCLVLFPPLSLRRTSQSRLLTAKPCPLPSYLHSAASSEIARVGNRSNYATVCRMALKKKDKHLQCNRTCRCSDPAGRTASRKKKRNEQEKKIGKEEKVCSCSLFVLWVFCMV